MILIPSGRFQMGEAPESVGRELGTGAFVGSQETPRHAVVLTHHYYLDAYEVTVRQWREFMAATSYASVRVAPSWAPDEPVRGLEFRDALAYADWVGCALPTEAQWERAARGGREGLAYPWGPVDDVSKRNGAGPEDGFERVAPVGSFVPNPYGLFDMSGNVEEWCKDWYNAKYYRDSPLEDPQGALKGWGHVTRGGTYVNDSPSLTVSRRGGNRDVVDLTGCRLCREVPK
jgi:formylglycine-generating enzyme required for sulfatase activity